MSAVTPAIGTNNATSGLDVVGMAPLGAAASSKTAAVAADLGGGDIDQMAPAEPRVERPRNPLMRLPEGEFSLVLRTAEGKALPLVLRRKGNSLGIRGDYGLQPLGPDGTFSLRNREDWSWTPIVAGRVSYDPLTETVTVQATLRGARRYDSREVSYYNCRGCAEYVVRERVRETSEIPVHGCFRLDGTNLDPAFREVATYTLTGGSHSKAVATVLDGPTGLWLRIKDNRLDYTVPIQHGGVIDCTVRHRERDFMHITGQLESDVISLKLGEYYAAGFGGDERLGGSRCPAHT
jgi:hypothetical protein